MVKRYSKSHCILSFLLVALILFSFISGNVYAQPQSPIPLSTGWQFRLGDSPKNDKDSFEWLYGSYNNPQWKPMSCPGLPQDEAGIPDVWVRIKLPETQWEDPSIFFRTNDQHFEVYLEDKLIYRFGNLENHNDKVAPGSPWHLISLPGDYQGKMLYIRMHTMFLHNAGYLREANIGSKADHIKTLIAKNINSFILGFLFIFLGVALMLLFVFRKKLESTFPNLGLFSVCLGVWLIAETDMKQLFYSNPRFWLYVAITSFYSFPIGFIYFVERVFADKTKPILRILWQAHIGFVAVALILDILKIVPCIFLLKAFYALVLITIIVIFTVVFKRASEGNANAKIFLGGFIVLSIAGIYDILGMYFRIVPWSSFIIPYGAFIFVLTLVYILARRVMEIYDNQKLYTMEIAEKNEELNKMYSEVNESRNTLAEWNKTLEQTVENRTSSIRNLLNNAGQGFLTFGEDLIIDDEYSSECIKLFSKNIKGLFFPQLIFPEDAEQAEFLKSILCRILEEKNNTRRQRYLPLLPEEVLINNKNIHIDYKIICDNYIDKNEIFMIILTDITYKRQLESQVEQERNILKMVVKVITNYNDFMDCVKDYESFCHRKVNDILRNTKYTIDEMIFEIFRHVHTFKGIFGQYEMCGIVASLHDFESAITDFKKYMANITINDLKDFISHYDMSNWLNDDMSILEEILGEQFMKQGSTLVVEKDRLMAIEDKMLAILSPCECKLLLPDIQKLRYKPFRDILRSYPEYIVKLADRMGKSVDPVEIIGGDMLVDTDLYSDFSKSLVHVFRNAVDHGLEAVEERIELGKREYGSIRCEIGIEEGNISLAISDDGRGIDVNTIRRKAVEKGTISSEAAGSLNEDELLNLIFADQFSTKDTVTELSGRGFGLAAVRKEVEKLKGKIKVMSNPGEGTVFKFLFPFEAMNELPEISASAIIDPLVQTAKGFLTEQTSTIIKYFNVHNINKAESIHLLEYTAFISVKGILSGRFILTMDEYLARNLVHNFVMEDMGEDERYNYIEDVLAETSNIIIGNSIKKFPELENLIIIEPPLTLQLKDATIKFKECTAWTCSIDSEAGKMRISFVAGETTFY